MSRWIVARYLVADWVADDSVTDAELLDLVVSEGICGMFDNSDAAITIEHSLPQTPREDEAGE